MEPPTPPPAPLKIEDIEVTETLKERLLDHDPRRHFLEREESMRAHLMKLLFDTGCITKTLVPGEKRGEHVLTMKIRAVKNA
jgi:hypothetical protein